MIAYAEHIVGEAAAQVRIYQQYPLAGHGHDGGQVNGHESFAHARAGAGDHQDVVAGVHHAEVQAGAQAAQAFYDQVGGVFDGQQAGGGVFAAPFLFGHGLLSFRQRHGGVDRQAEFFDVVRVFDAAVEHGPYQYDAGANHTAQQQGYGGDQGALGFYRGLGVYHGVVHYPYVAHGAGAGDVQLLDIREHLQVDFVADFHITAQAYQFLLGFWQAADAGVQLGAAAFEFGHLRGPGPVARVGGLKALFNFGALEFQLRDLGFQVDDLVQHCRAFGADVDGFFLHLVVIELLFGGFQFLLYFRQGSSQEFQGLGGFGAGALYVLAYVVLAHFRQDGFGHGRVGMLKGQFDDAGAFAFFAGTYLPLQRHGGSILGALGYVEAGAGAGVQFGDHYAEAVGIGRGVGLAFQYRLFVLVQQGPAAVFACLQDVAARATGYVHAGDGEFFTAPGVAFAPFGLGQFSRLATKAAGQGGAYYGEIIRAGNDVQVQVVHYLAQYPTAFDQFDFGAGVGGGFQQSAQVFHTRQAACFLFYLDQCVGAVHRRLNQGVEHADGGEQ